MRTTLNNNINNAINPTHLELGLLHSASLMLLHNKDEMPNAFKLLVDSIPNIVNLEDEIETKALGLLKLINGSFLLCCGFEAKLIDHLANQLKSLLVVPNSDEVNFERLAANYSHHNSFEVSTPFHAANMICPDTSILVPVYPLEDSTMLSYNYSSKLLTIDARKNSYQIIGLVMCNPIPLEYGYDPTGLTKVLSPVDSSYFTDFLTLKTK